MSKESKFKKGEEEDEEEVSWQDSYSDLMTDLLAIFVVLFSFAMMSQAFQAANAASGQKPDAVADVIVREQIFPDDNGFMEGQGNNILDQGSNSSDQTSGTSNQESNTTEQASNTTGQDNTDSINKSIDDYINEAELSGQLSVTDQGDNQIVLRVASSLLFDSGRADINSNAKPMLGKISEILKEYGHSIKMVRIEGHTDNIPVSNKQFDSNWELSTSRAVNVLKCILETSKLEPEKFSAVGYGEFHPIARNNTTTNRAKNRRVDFVIETVSN